MSRNKAVRPTDGELEILCVLWKRGSGTVRQVHQVLAADKNTSYNTTLKLLQIMNDKGLVTRDESRRPQVYRPSLPEGRMQQRLMSDFLERVFGGSARKLMAALTATGISQDELAQIRSLLDGVEEEKE